MRYFMRSGQDVILQTRPNTARIVPQGKVVSFDEGYKDEEQWARQLAGDPEWTEVADLDGNPLPDIGNPLSNANVWVDPAVTAERLANAGLDQPATTPDTDI